MERTCKDIQDTLVDYTDGLLSPEEKCWVSEHIGKCEDCRQLFKALGRSLEIAQIIWEDNLSDVQSIKNPDLLKGRKIHWLRYAAVAASILLVVTMSFIWRWPKRPPEPQVSFEEIEQSINESANAARLLAATELLAEYPDAKEIVEQQYRYIIEKYPQTSAAAKIKLKNQ